MSTFKCQKDDCKEKINVVIINEQEESRKEKNLKNKKNKK